MPQQLKPDTTKSPPYKQPFRIYFDVVKDETTGKYIVTGKMDRAVFKESADVLRAAFDKVLDRFNI